jgi:hypothetical protein
MNTTSIGPPERVSTRKSPIPAATSPAAHVKVFTDLELSGRRKDRGGLLRSDSGLSICADKHTPSVGRVKWEGRGTRGWGLGTKDWD